METCRGKCKYFMEMVWFIEHWTPTDKDYRFMVSECVSECLFNVQFMSRKPDADSQSQSGNEMLYSHNGGEKTSTFNLVDCY